MEFGYFLGRRNKIEVHEIPNQLELTFDANELPKMKNLVVHPVQEVKVIPVYERQGQKLVKVVEEGENFVASKIKEAMTTSKEVVEESCYTFYICQ